MRPVRAPWSRYALPTLFAAALAMGACSDQSEIGPAEILEVRVDPDTLVLVLGFSDTLKAFPIDERGSFLPNRHIAWASGNDAIATVDEDGLVTATGLGMTMVTATTGKVSGSAVIQVVPAPAINASTTAVPFAAVAQSGVNPTTTVDITNSGGSVLDELAVGTINYGAGATGWLNAVLDQTSAPAVLTLTASVTGLAIGTYTATVPVTEPDAPNSPLDIVVTFTVTADAPTTIEISAGDGQSAAVNSAVTVPPAVLVTDQFGNPVQGVAVTFAVTGGGGSITGGNATTNASGIAAVGSWTLGTSTGANTLQASSTGLTGSPITFTATATAGAASQIAVNNGNGQNATVNTAVAVAPSVIVRDAFNNPVAGVAVTFAVATGGGSITGGNATTTASGIATVGSWTLGQTAGSNTLTATATGLAGSPVTFTATGNADAPASVAVQAGNNQTATVNTAVGTDPAVIVRDQFNNPVPGVAVTWAVTAGGGSVIPGAGATTNASGIATVTSWTLGTTAGTSNNTLRATVSGLPPVDFTASANPAAASVLAKSQGDNQAATAGQAVAVPPRVLVTDQFGNPISGVAITFQVASGGGSITGGNATTNASGLASVGSWTLGNTAGTNTLTAAATGLTTVTFTATGNPGNASAMALSGGNNQTGTVGADLATPLAVLVTDNLGNPVQGVTVGWATGNGSVNPASSQTNASGIATTVWTLGGTAGPQTATGAVAGLTGSPVTFNATATAGAAASLAKNNGDSQNATVNTAVAVAPQVLVTDQFGNPVSGVSVTFAVTGGGGSVTGAAQTTNAAGLASVGSWTLGTAAGANTLQASVTGLTSVTFSATGTAGAATQIAVNTGNAQNATVNTAVAVAPSVIVRDAFNNPVQGVSVTFAVTGGGGSATGTSQTTNASGIATVGSWTLGTVAGANTLSATSAGLTGSPVQFTATGTAGAATTIALVAGNGQNATVNTAVTTDPSVRVTDQFGNNVSGVTVTWARTGGNGSFVCVAVSSTNCTQTTNAAGLATLVSWTMGTTAGTNSITATVAGLTGSPVSFTATGTAGPVASLTLNSTNNQTTRPGTSVGSSPTVTATDAFGNPVSGATVTFTITNATGPGTLTCIILTSPTNTCNRTTNASGVASVFAWTLSTSGVPTAAAPTLGRYTNTVGVSSGSASLTVTAFAAWSYSVNVTPIVTTNNSLTPSGGSCTGCHSKNWGVYTDITGNSVDDVPLGCTITKITVSGDLTNSLLYRKIIGTQPANCGTSMPQLSGSPLLSLTERNIIRDWILNGVPNN
jgi:adhesin/invasin